MERLKIPLIAIGMLIVGGVTLVENGAWWPGSWTGEDRETGDTGWSPLVALPAFLPLLVLLAARSRSRPAPALVWLQLILVPACTLLMYAALGHHRLPRREDEGTGLAQLAENGNNIVNLMALPVAFVMIHLSAAVALLQESRRGWILAIALLLIQSPYLVDQQRGISLIITVIALLLLRDCGPRFRPMEEERTIASDLLNS